MTKPLHLAKLTQWLCALTCATALSVPLHLAAEDITLISLDGTVRLAGQLVGVTDDHYVLKGEFGEVRVATSKMRCEGNACPPTDPADTLLRIAGSDTIGEELMPLLLAGLAESQGAASRKTTLDDTTAALSVLSDEGGGAEVFAATITSKGSGTGFVALLDGTAEVAMSSRPVKPEEADMFALAGLGNPTDGTQEHAFAVDGLLVIINPDLPIEALKSEDVSGLLSGRITTWSEVGGPDIPVKVYTRDEKSGTYATVTDAMLKPFGETMSPDAVVINRSDALSAAVAGDPGAIGYVGFAFKGDSKPVRLISACNVVNEPSAFSSKTGEYPLSRRLFLYTTNKDLPEPARDLIAFATSPAAYPFIEKAGFLSYLPETREQSQTLEAIRTAIKTSTSRAEANVLRELFVDLTEWDRLSTTFRFKTGSARLDNASEDDLVRLIDFLRTQGGSVEVAFVGFTDAEGEFEANRALGESRARTIADLVTKALKDTGIDAPAFVIKSYGELNPVACNDDVLGQKNNRRVEIWVHH
jgi:phosphate transport system substrate-binding protein